MASPYGEEDRAGAGAASSESFVAIDMESLLILASPNDEQSTPNSRIQMHKTLSRKGPYRGGGGGGAEKKKKAEGGGATVFTAGGGAQVAEKSSPEQPGHVAGEQGSSSLPHGATPTGGVVERCRRNNSGKRSSAWLDPRRIVMLFATLSSMGTLILLYLTLSMGSRMVGGKANAQ